MESSFYSRVRRSGPFKTFVVIIGAALLLLMIIIIIAAYTGQQLPFKELDEVGFIQVKGNMLRVESFSVFIGEDESFKHLAMIEVTEVTQVEGHNVFLPLVDPGDVLTVEIKDSRMNLLIDFVPKQCYQADGSAVRVCEYTVTQEGVVMVIREDLSATSLLPEFSGVPR